MNELQQVFNYQGVELRTVEKDGEHWFIAQDVCRILEIDTSLAVNGQFRNGSISGGLDEDEKDTHIVSTPGGCQPMLVVSEAGLYSLILKSRKDKAKNFKRWVTHEVIPSIRKHGAYMTPDMIEKVLTDPDTIIKLATNLKEEQTKRIAAEAQIEKDRPKVLFAEALEVSNNSILIGELAKLLKQNGINIGQNRLFEILRKEGYLGRKGEYYNLPTQRSMELKLFEIKTSSINNPDGSVRTTRTTKVTGKGCIYFINKFKNEAVPA